ncbi:SusF/SusE family outer membrane protein [Flammeovirga sp. EKP202]|uniref:SusE domain-containing protein n=1 Tax=Flammeovirga sp. EKP202 TaxID=2770592 RepID=UPI00165FED79|nr:SusF/SusE family outer membrane protein [Flammeovirga sp. EKP202]MBD0403417.1 SusF/SusE family outer membrane protein [Flammeovirga sp. EKP202]
MRYLNYILILFTVVMFNSCKEKEDVVFDKNTTTPSVLSSTDLKDQYTLTKETAEKEDDEELFASFVWTEANMGVSASLVYQLQIGLGDNFADLTSDVKVLTDTTLSKTINKALGELNADTASFNDVTIRVISKIANQSNSGTVATTISNVLTTSVKPYPSNQKLFLVKGPEFKVEDSNLYMISSNADHKYAGTFELETGVEYKFVSSDKEDELPENLILYGVDSETDPTKLVAGSDVAFTVAETGKYSTSADLNAGPDYGKFEYAKAQPILWVPGSHNGWSHDIEDADPEDPTSMTKVNLVSENNDGVYTGKIWLTAEFKFTNQPNWDGTNYGSVDGANFDLDTDPGAGNHHVDNYNGTGLYTLEVNVNTLKFKILEFQGPPIEIPEENALFIVGDHNGWRLNPSDNLVETAEGSNIFTGYQNISDAFRLQKAVVDTIENKLVATNTYGSPEVTETTDPNNPYLEGFVEEDGLYTFRAPVSGTYKVHVDLGAGSYELEHFVPALVTAPANRTDIVLESDESAATTFTWTASMYGKEDVDSYTLQVKSSGGTAVLATGTATTVDVAASILNGAILGLDGAEIGVAYGVDVQVISHRANEPDLVSAPIAITVTPYEAAQAKYWLAGHLNGWSHNEHDVVNLADAATKTYKNTLWFADGAFKISSKNDWTGTNYGFESEGKVSATGGDIPVTANHYAVEFNPEALTYSLTPLVWGVIGSATPNGWNGETAMTFDAAAKTWTWSGDLTEGAFKFRANGSWDYNMGSSDGSTLENNGSDISVAAGNYTIVMTYDESAKQFTYTITPNVF